METNERNFNTISPSAGSLLLLKGITNIPFARQAAELLVAPEEYMPGLEDKNTVFWARTLHFESRYWSIDQLMADIPFSNVLELSSGFSFRGLDLTQGKDVHYVDTDLSDLIATKRQFIEALQKDLPAPKGVLETLPLNALDETQFGEVLSHFPKGEILIVNEGLLMYLDKGEKVKLCQIIHRILKERGGYWITADIYLKKDMKQLGLKMPDELRKFLDDHQVEQNKFESLADAEDFFSKAGFIVDRTAISDHAHSVALPYLLRAVQGTSFQGMKKREKIQYTWRLRVASHGNIQ